MGLMTLNEEIRSVVAKAGDSVVEVVARRRGPSSGVAWPGDGLVVTALHTVEEDEGIEIRTVRERLVNGQCFTVDPLGLQAVAEPCARRRHVHQDPRPIGGKIMASGEVRPLHLEPRAFQIAQRLLRLPPAQVRQATIGKGARSVGLDIGTMPEELLVVEG